jgi:hemolysin activation/secretion protein
VKLHADGQWAGGPLISNEQFAMGGTTGVRGYTDGEAYGDAGWRFSIEPRTPQVNIGMVDGDIPFWVRGSVFLDYGQIYDVGQVPAGFASRANYCGMGFGFTANIGSHMDGRLTVGCPLIAHEGISPVVHIYFGVGVQF